MASQVSICNLALLKFGEITIDSIDDSTKEARACKALWDIVRDNLIYQFPWNFAAKRETLTQLSTEPDFEYDYEYSLPSDCLRAWEMYDSDSNWVIEGGKLLTDDDDVELKYISKVTDVSKFVPSFQTCLATALAAELTVKLGESKSLRLQYLQELNMLLKLAFRANYEEGKRAKSKDEEQMSEGNFSWQLEGR